MLSLFVILHSTQAFPYLAFRAVSIASSELTCLPSKANTGLVQVSLLVSQDTYSPLLSLFSQIFKFSPHVDLAFAKASNRANSAFS